MQAPATSPTARYAVLQLIRGGLVALALLALGEAAPRAFPVHVVVNVDDSVRFEVDGQPWDVGRLALGPPQRVLFERPGPLEREIQVDGTHAVAAPDRDAAVLERWMRSPLYAIAAWLRDERGYSSWRTARLTELPTGAVLAEGLEDVQAARLPPRFRLEAWLERPEAAAFVWLVQDAGQREGLELNRETRNARWLVRGFSVNEALPRQFFPEAPLPFAAGLAHLLGRAAMAGYVLLLGSAGLAGVLGLAVRGTPRRVAVPRRRWMALPLVVWVAAAGWVTWALYRQVPHVLDGVSYTFQAGVFRSGRLSLPVSPAAPLLLGPFQVVADGRWFSQYPPGAPFAYAAGDLVGLGWLVGAAGGATMIAGTALAGWWLFGRGTAWLVLLLGCLSPFVLFQAGSYLSHPVAGGLLGMALACTVRGVLHERRGWLVASGALLGAAFAVRETGTVLFAAPLLVWVLWRRGTRALLPLAIGGAPWLVAYGAYNAAQTGNPFLLPRAVFAAGDRFGFGDGMGFHMRHTLAAGLANADVLLTLLQFDLFGWPPLIALGLLAARFLAGAADTRDLLCAAGVALFVLAFVTYFYHGVALGPRYYYEALPWLLLLGARGTTALADLARKLGASLSAARLAASVLVALLSAYTLTVYLPRQVERRQQFTGLDNNLRLDVAALQPTLFGPRLQGLPPRSLVTTDDWWLHMAVLSPLSCPSNTPVLPADCPAVFAYAPDASARALLQEQFPDRTVYQAVVRSGVVRFQVVP